MNEEKLKKNTDCVYFLASPLTCKKGNECEFRHSEIARLNPRDCWFWLAGKCTKYQCTFRHPPLDGLPAATPTVGKHRVPCFYFGQGYCAKGEKCIFMHGLPPAAVASKITMPQKLSKPNDGVESTEKSIKRIGVLLASKLPVKSNREAQVAQAECEALNDDAKISSSKTCLSLELQEDKVTDASSRMPATPARGGSHESVSGSNKPKQVSTRPDGSPNQVYPCAIDISAKLPCEEGNDTFSGRNRCSEDQPGVKQLQRVESSKNKVYDCNESEDRCEETSFDVLIDAARTDQVTYVEDTDNLPACDVPIAQVRDSTQRDALQGQDLVNYDYTHYYIQDSPYEFEVQNMYDPSEQHSYYDNMNTFDHVGSQKSCTLPLTNYGQEMALEKKSYQTFCAEDLRHHIIKRRREERRLKLEEDFCQRHHRGFFRNDLQHHQCDGPRSYLEGWIRGTNVPDGQFYGRPTGRQSVSGYCHTEFKRGLDHVASELWRANRGSAFNKRLHPESENFHVKGKIDHWLHAEAMDPAFHTECVGIKGFAQAKAENLKGLRQPSYFNHKIDHQAPLPKRRMYQFAGSAFGIGCHRSRDWERCEFPRTPDFEGPKPLSVLMEEKHRRLASADVEERPKASRIENEGGFHGRTSDFEGSTPLLKEKQNGVANGEGRELEGANTSLRMEKEVEFVSLNGEFQSSKENSIYAKKNDIFLNGNTNLPMVPLHGIAEGGGPTSKAKSPCLMKMKDAKIYPVDTELSLSLSCSREDHKSIVDDYTSDAMIGNSCALQDRDDS